MKTKVWTKRQVEGGEVRSTRNMAFRATGKQRMVFFRMGIAIALALIGSGAAFCTESQRRPNVLFILTDDQRWDALGLAGHPHGDGSPDKHLAELYDLNKDPEERFNLVELPEFAPILQEMKSELAHVMQSVGLSDGMDPMPIDEGVKQGLPDQKIR